MSTRWVSTAQSLIFTRVKTAVTNKRKAKYPDITFTTSDEGNEQKFPTIYVKFLESPVLGADLEGKGINGMNCNVQVDVVANKTQGDKVASDIIFDVLDVLVEEFMFSAYMLPLQVPTGNDLKRRTMRLRRVIGADDKL